MTASVIVPTYQRPRALAACLTALADLSLDEPFEVVVVNDGGELPDRILDAVRDRLHITVLHQANAGPAAARNAGAARARGEILAFTDDDCAPAPDWLQRLVSAVRDEPDCMAGGRTVNALPRDRCATASQLLVDFLYDYNDDGRGVPFFTSNNLAVGAGRFRDLGGFDTSFRRAAGEDRDLCDHWLHRGGHLRYVPAAVVHHAHAMTLRAFWNQHFAYGTGAWRFHRMRARRGGDRVRVEPLSFYARLVTYPMRRRLGLAAIPVTGLMILSQIANVAGYAAAHRRSSPRMP